jgi:hypothetical protein
MSRVAEVLQSTGTLFTLFYYALYLITVLAVARAASVAVQWCGTRLHRLVKHWIHMRRERRWKARQPKAPKTPYRTNGGA